MILLDLVHNIALLVALAAAFQVIEGRLPMRRFTSQAIYGLLFGAVGLVGMMTPVRFMPGIIFDGRSIILSVAGLFGGPVVALIAALMCGAYRLWVGGAGAAMGLSVIAESAALGVVFHYWRRRATRPLGVAQLWGFGLLVHGVMLGLIVLLPGGARQAVWHQLGPAIVGVYPVATMLICMLFLDYEKQRNNRTALMESEARFRAICLHTPDHILIQDRNLRYQFVVNPQLGLTVAAMVGKCDADFLAKQDAEKLTAIKRRVLETGEPFRVETSLQNLKGEAEFFDGIYTPKVDPDGNTDGLIGYFRNVTGRKQAEERLRKANRALRMISDCNQELVRATNQADLLHGICQIAVEQGGYRMVWVGLAAQDEAKSVRPVARFGLDEGYLDTASITWADTERGRGPTGTAIRTGQPVVNRDIRTDLTYEPWREAALQRGYASSIALPLKDGERCFGTLNLYAAEPDAFDPEEVELLGELARNLAFGIRALRQRAEREVAEDALRESEGRLRAILDSTPFPIALVDALDNRIGFWSRSALTRFGHVAPTAAEWYQLAYPDPDYQREVIARWKPCLEKARLSGQPVNAGEYRITCRDGSVRVCELYAAFLAERLVVTFNDITARKQAEERDRLAHEVLQRLNYPGNTADMIRDVLQLVQRSTGVGAVGIRLRAGDDFPYYAQDGFSSDFLSTENTLVARARDGGVCRNEDGSICLECTCGLVLSGKTGPDHGLFTEGGSFWTNNSLPLLDLPADQDPRLRPRNRCIHDGYLSVALVPLRAGDETIGLLQLNDRRPGQFTPELIHFLEGLATSTAIALKREQAVEEKDRLQVQFTQAQKMESVGRLAGGVAHDFNNLLMGIMSYVELCRDGLPPDHPVRGYLDEIATDAQRSADLTRQLLAFARKQTISPKALSLNDAVAGMLKLLRRLIGENIAIDWRPGASIWPVLLDPSQIDQVMANLALNARDAIDGVGSISIETRNITLGHAHCSEHPGSLPGDFVLLTVSDSGRGMAKDVLDHVFEPFFTTKEVGKGTGLGLATVYGIVTQNNGFIEVDSEPGRGTTFKIHLPRLAVQGTAAATTHVPPERPRGNETILLVEDEKSVRFTVSRFLRDLGYTVLAAEDPGKALRLAAEHPGEIRLLITDMIMPGMSGLDLAESLSERYPTIKRLFISGFTADVIARDGVLDDDLSFLAKPFSRDDLAQKVREVLGG